MTETKTNTGVILPETSMLPVWRTIYSAMVGHLNQSGLPFSVAGATIHLYVHPEDAEPARLADAIYIPRQSMTFTLDALERQGLATRTPHPEDRRKKIIVLSPKGQTLAKSLLEKLLLFETRAFKDFTEKERTTLKMLSERLAEQMTLQNRDV
jgi:DNA-binding MarR family transcriptional regulator